jgi:hypothetical protein
MIRVKAIDTVEQVTDFASAADHGIALRKFQELSLPISSGRLASVPDKTTGSGSFTADANAMDLPQRSVFEKDLDRTDLSPEKRAVAIDKRWKFTGPWLAGMSPGDFRQWLSREIRPKRPEFRKFLKTQLAGELNAAAAARALDRSEEQPAPIDPASVTEDQLIDYLRALRNNNQRLYQMVGQFLDLAPLAPPKVDALPGPGSQKEFRTATNPYAENGPPATHPSAGLSYLRTSMYMDNHPIYGPQKHHPPVVARVMKPRRQTLGFKAVLGVSGFIANAPQGDTVFNRAGTNRLLDRIDPDLVGGAKIWVQPHRATVDSNGHLVLAVADVRPPMGTLIAQELLGDAECLGVLPEVPDVDRVQSAKEMRDRFSAPLPMSNAVQYGVKM